MCGPGAKGKFEGKKSTAAPWIVRAALRPDQVFIGYIAVLWLQYSPIRISGSMRTKKKRKQSEASLDDLKRRWKPKTTDQQTTDEKGQKRATATYSKLT